MLRNLDLRSELSFLTSIDRLEISPYDTNFFIRSQEYHIMLAYARRTFEDLKTAVKSMTEGMFKWEEELDPLSWQSDLLTICKHYNALPEKQMVDIVELPGFRETIDAGTIRVLIESTEELFENPERLFNLNLISQTFELWMRMTYLQDINYMPRIDSRHIQLMDPMMRNKIRENNKQNKEFYKKYLGNENFQLKKFLMVNLEKLFETNKARALGGGLRRLRLNLLKLVRSLFELGLWNNKEVPSLLELLHSKLQMLFVEENEFGDIYNPESNERGSAYDPYYSEN
jgi:hypothetical protein